MLGANMQRYYGQGRERDRLMQGDGTLELVRLDRVAPGGGLLPQGTVRLLYNASTEPTVIMVATLFAADQPDMAWTNEQGTPTP